MRLRRRNRPEESLPDSVWGPEIAAIMHKRYRAPEYSRWFRAIGVAPIPSVVFAVALFRQQLEFRLLYAWLLGIASGYAFAWIAVWMEDKGWIEIDGADGD